MLRSGRWVNRLFGRREKGMAMVMALIALALGMLLIVPTLSYVSTGVKAASVYKGVTSELYAADAGVEYALWSLNKGLPVNSPITVGGIPVTITVSQLSELPYGPLISDDGPQSWRLQVTSAIVNNGNGTFTYTITIANVGTSTVHLQEVGAGLPEGFSYVTGSTSGGFTSANPSSVSGQQIYWTLASPKLDSQQSKQHIFRIQGSGTPEGYYSWVVANSASIGTVSDCFGYNIVSQANGGTTIRANVIKNVGAIFPVSWKVN